MEEAGTLEEGMEEQAAEDLAMEHFEKMHRAETTFRTTVIEIGLLTEDEIDFVLPVLRGLEMRG